MRKSLNVLLFIVREKDSISALEGETKAILINQVRVDDSEV